MLPLPKRYLMHQLNLGNHPSVSHSPQLQMCEATGFIAYCLSLELVPDYTRDLLCILAVQTMCITLTHYIPCDRIRPGRGLG